MASRPYARGWRELRLQAFATYGRICHLKLPGCTVHATTIDHLDAVALHGAHLPSLDRVRPACAHCNYSHGASLGNALRRKGSRGLPTATPSQDWFA